MANKTNSKEVLDYFNNIKKARQGMYVNSYNDYLQKAQMGTQACGGAGKPKCFKKFGNRFGKFWNNYGKKIATGLGIGAVTALGIKGIQKAKQNQNNNINPGSGGPGFFENMFGGG
jgi:hypothetical protein